MGIEEVQARSTCASAALGAAWFGGARMRAQQRAGVKQFSRGMQGSSALMPRRAVTWSASLSPYRCREDISETCAFCCCLSMQTCLRMQSALGMCTPLCIRQICGGSGKRLRQKTGDTARQHLHGAVRQLRTEDGLAAAVQDKDDVQPLLRACCAACLLQRHRQGACGRLSAGCSAQKTQHTWGNASSGYHRAAVALQHWRTT